MSKYLKLFSRCKMHQTKHFFWKKGKMYPSRHLWLHFLLCFALLCTFKISIIFDHWATKERSWRWYWVLYLYLCFGFQDPALGVCSVVRSAGAAIENVTRRCVGHTTFRFQHFSWCTRERSSRVQPSIEAWYFTTGLTRTRYPGSPECPKDNGQ